MRLGLMMVLVSLAATGISGSGILAAVRATAGTVALSSVAHSGANTTSVVSEGLQPPGRPGAPVAVEGVSSATVSVSPPSSGGATDSFTVTASPDGATCTVPGESGSCVVRGLVNGLTYSFTATATNSAGTSPRSAPSNSVTLRLTPIDIYYFSLGGPAALGDPLRSEVDNGRFGGAYRDYARGTVYWSPTTFSHVNSGAIRGAYAVQGWENGYLGYPTSDEIGPIRDGGVYQSFQGGTIYWSPATGAHPNTGAIRAAYAAQGWENGYLGYPTSNEYPMCGGAAQDFQGGRITWTLAGGTAATRH